MARKLRVSVLFNEPVTNCTTHRKYVSASGRLQEGPESIARPIQPVTAAGGKTEQMVDLSEVGVLEEMEDIKVALNSLGYRTTVVNVNSDMHRLIDHLREEKPDLVFNIVECVENEALQEMNVAGLYELLKIPYTGAGPLALGTSLNKPRVKQILTYYGIKTPKFWLFHPSVRIMLPENLEYPLIVKPSHEDGSVGISNSSVVDAPADLRRKIRYIFEEFEQPAIVEQYINGRELNAAILGYSNPVVLPISEIDFSGLNEGMPRIVSYAAKWMHGTIEYEGTKGLCPAKIPASVEAKVRDSALKCFRIFGLRDYARIDFRLSPNGEVYVLEVNPNPDISDEAGFARSARAHGLTFTDTIGKIVESALERSRNGI
jgi:D-alanine-D-alanine ligase